ncbi:MAG: hypothetical protein VCC00_12565 [Deltaproteobacteria bacterium]
MRLTRIRIKQAPGIDTPFLVDEIAAGINVLVGPNGSGKTTLRRTIQQMLWPDAKRDAPASVEAFFDDDGQQLRAERQGHKVQWQRDGSPAEAPRVPGAHLARCYSIGMSDLLTNSTDTDTKITNEIRKEMSGGYDLAELKKSFTPSGSRAAHRECIKAAANLREVRGEFRDLAKEEMTLEELASKWALADAARLRVPLLTEAYKAAKARHELAGLMAERETLPPQLALYSGNEGTQLSERDSELETNTEEAQGHEAKAVEAREKAAATNLEDDPDAVQLDAWGERAGQLGTLELKRDDRLRECEKLRLEAEAVHKSLVGADAADTAPQISLEVLDEIEAGLSGIQHAQERVAAIQAELALQKALVEKAGADSRASENARLLRDGLTATESRPSAQRLRVAFAGALLAVLAAGAIAVVIEAPPWLGIAGPALVLALFLPLLPHIRQPSSRLRESIIEQLIAGGYRVPAQWTADVIQPLLRELDIRAAEEQLARERRQQARKEEARLVTATTALEQQEVLVAASTRTAGITAKGQLSLVTIIEGVRALLAVASARQTATSEHAAAVTSAAESLAAANSWLAQQGYPKAKDAAAVRSCLGDLRDRSLALHSAHNTLAGLEGNIADTAKRRMEIEAKIKAIYKGVNLVNGDRDSLHCTLDLHPKWAGLAEKIHDQKGHLARLETSLVGQPELSGFSIEDATAALQTAETDANALLDLSKQMTAIETKVDEARKGSRMEERLTSLVAARTNLEDFREDLLHRGAATFLLEAVSEEHDQTSRPPVLNLAMKYFETFTRNVYELIPPEGTEPTFRALEVDTKRGLALSELSSGTRIQLLLAVRLAFAIHEAGDQKLPIFLDEALSTADPKRFAAVVESLQALASKGFQVFYLTSNPTDAAYWQAIGKASSGPPPRILDLAAIRGQGEPMPDLATLTFPDLPKLASPEGLTPEKYARALEVPAIRFDKPVESLHLYYLLGPDTETLHTILRVTKLRSLGRWVSFANRTREAGILPDAVSDLVDARARCARAVFEARSIGRGKPIDRSVLERSKAVSNNYLDPFVAMAEEFQGDAKRFVEALTLGTDKRLNRYQTSKRELLIAFLQDQEYLDTSPLLEIHEIRAHTLAALRDDFARGTLDTDTCHALIDRLLHAGASHAATTSP